MSNRTIAWHQSLTIDLIASPFHVFGPDEDVESALILMQQNNWDVAGYSQHGAANADVIVNRVELAKPTSTALPQVCQALNIGLLVAEQTPILDAISRIVENDRLYVFGKDGVNRLVTLADLNKKQVTLLIFGILSSLEVRLLEWIRTHGVTCENLSQWLPMDRIKSAEETLNRRKEKNEDTDLLDCLMFIDKTKLIQKLDIRSLLDPYGRKKWATYFDRMQRVRNDVAHARAASEAVAWPKIVELLAIIQSMLDVECKR